LNAHARYVALLFLKAEYGLTPPGERMSEEEQAATPAAGMSAQPENCGLIAFMRTAKHQQL
jgi:hypothetical protein